MPMRFLKPLEDAMNKVSCAFVSFPGQWSEMNVSGSENTAGECCAQREHSTANEAE